MEISAKELGDLLNCSCEKEEVKSFSPEYVIVRTCSAGVFAGFLVSRNGKEVELKKARRLWYWQGAASLSQLAQSGTSDSTGCKFPEPVEKVVLTEAIEILSVSKDAQKIIENVSIWKQ